MTQRNDPEAPRDGDELRHDAQQVAKASAHLRGAIVSSLARTVAAVAECKAPVTAAALASIYREAAGHLGACAAALEVAVARLERVGAEQPDERSRP